MGLYKFNHSFIMVKRSFLAITLGLSILLVTASYALAVSTSPIPPTYFGLHFFSTPTVAFGDHRIWDPGYRAWADINTSPGVYTWNAVDGGIAQLPPGTSAPLEIVFTLAYTPSWASTNGQNNAPPEDLNADGTGTNQIWKNWVTAVATRYNGIIHAYEVWNEANYSGFWTGTNAQLLRLHQDAYAIIKAIDPTALVLLNSDSCYKYAPGTTCPGTDMRELFALGVQNYIDVVTFHGYFDAVPENLIAIINNVKSAMAAYGVNKPIWDTEGSWGVSADLPDLNQRAAYVARSYLLRWSNDVSRFYWYQWDNCKWGTLFQRNAGGSCNNTGIQLSGVAYRELYNWMVGATMSTPCAANGSVWTCGFSRDGGYKGLAVWNTTGNSSFTVPTEYTTFRDISGGSGTLGSVVTIGLKPILLEGAEGPPPPPSGTVLEKTVSSSSSDSEECLSTGTVNVTSSDLELISDPDTCSTGSQMVGMRFSGVTIPRGATITRAHILFEVDEVSTSAAELTFRAEASDNAASFETSARNISSRAKTAASAAWSAPSWNTAGATSQTPDLSSVIQEVVSRSGWASGGALAVLVSGSGKRTAVSYNLTPGSAPLLHVKYLTQ